MLQIIFIIFISFKFLSYIWGLVSGSAYKGATDTIHACAMIVGSTMGFGIITALSIISAVYPASTLAFVFAIVLASCQGLGALLLLAFKRFGRAFINLVFMTLFIVSLVVGA